jgi:hypothetical protein
MLSLHQMFSSITLPLISERLSPTAASSSPLRPSCISCTSSVFDQVIRERIGSRNPSCCSSVWSDVITFLIQGGGGALTTSVQSCGFSLLPLRTVQWLMRTIPLPPPRMTTPSLERTSSSSVSLYNSFLSSSLPSCSSSLASECASPSACFPSRSGLHLLTILAYLLSISRSRFPAIWQTDSSANYGSIWDLRRTNGRSDWKVLWAVLGGNCVGIIVSVSSIPVIRFLTVLPILNTRFFLCCLSFSLVQIRSVFRILEL